MTSGSRCLISSFFFNDTATPEIYTLSLHDALPISGLGIQLDGLQGSAHLGRRRDQRGQVVVDLDRVPVQRGVQLVGRLVATAPAHPCSTRLARRAGSEDPDRDSEGLVSLATPSTRARLARPRC